MVEELVDVGSGIDPDEPSEIVGDYFTPRGAPTEASEGESEGEAKAEVAEPEVTEPKSVTEEAKPAEKEETEKEEAKKTEKTEDKAKEDVSSEETEDNKDEPEAEAEKEAPELEITDDTIVEIDDEPVSIKELKDVYPLVQKANQVQQEFQGWVNRVQEGANDPNKGRPMAVMEGALELFREMYPDDPEAAYGDFIRGCHAMYEADRAEFERVNRIEDPELKEEFLRNRRLAQQVPQLQKKLNPLLEQQQKVADEYASLQRKQEAEKTMLGALEKVGLKDRQDLLEQVATEILNKRQLGLNLTIEQAANKVAYMERKRTAAGQVTEQLQDTQKKKEEVEKALDQQSGITPSKKKKDDDNLSDWEKWEKQAEKSIVPFDWNS